MGKNGKKWEKYDKCFGFRENLWKFKVFFWVYEGKYFGSRFQGLGKGFWGFWVYDFFGLGCFGDLKMGSF